MDSDDKLIAVGIICFAAFMIACCICGVVDDAHRPQTNSPTTQK